MEHGKYYILVDHGYEGWEPFAFGDGDPSHNTLAEAVEAYADVIKATLSSANALIVKVIDPVQIALQHITEGGQHE